MKLLKKVWIILPLGLVLVLSGSLLWYLKTDHFQTWAKELVVAQLQRTTGLACSVKNIRIDVLGGKFNVTGLVLQPPSGMPDSLNLSVEEIRGSLSIASLWHFKVRLAELYVLRPRLTLASSDKGSAWDPENLLRTLRMSFEIETGQLTVQGGVVNLNNKAVPFELALRDLSCELRYVPGPSRYIIRLAYENGQINWAGRDISYSLNARLDLSLERLEIESFEIHSQRSLLRGSASVPNWKFPVLSVRGSGVVDGRDLVLFHSSLSEVQGDLNLLADLVWDESGFRCKGTVSTPAGSYRGTAVEQFKSDISVEREVLTLSNVAGNIGGGRIEAEAAFQLDAGAQAANHVKISASGLALRYAGKMLRLPQLECDNRADALIEMDWRHGMEDMELNGSADLHGTGETSFSKSATPLGGNILFRLTEGSWSIPAAQFHSSHTTIELHMPSPGGLLQTKLSTDRIGEPLSILSKIVPAVDSFLKNQPDVSEMPGAFDLDGDFQINSPAQIGFSGAIRVKDGRWQSYKVDEISAHAIWTGPHIEFDTFLARSGAASALGKVDLRFASQESDRAGLAFTGSLQKISIDTLKDIGIQIDADVSGLLSGEGEVSNQSGQWEGKGQVLIEKGRYGQEAFDKATARLGLDGRVLKILQGDVSRGSAHVVVTGEVDLDTLQMDISARMQGLALRDAPAIRERVPDLEGHLAAEASIYGTASHLALRASYSLTGLRYQSWSFGDGAGTLELKDRIISSKAEIQLESGTLKVEARVSMDQGLPGKATLLLQNLNLQKLIEGRGPAFLSSMSTALQGRVDVEGRFEDPDNLVFSGELDGAGIGIRGYELRNSAKIRFSIAKKRLVIEKTTVAGDGTSLILGGTIPLDGSPYLDLSLNGNFNLKLLSQIESRLQGSGTAGLDVRMTGTIKDPQVIGQMTLKESRMDFSDSPLYFSSLRGNIIFSRSTIRLENVTGDIASGSAQFSGFLEHQNFQLRTLNIQISVQKARLPYPKDLRPVIDAQLALRGNRDAQILAGEINVIQADYVRSFSLLEQFGGRSLSSAGPLTNNPIFLGLRLNINIRSDNGLYLDNELARLRAGMSLTLAGTPAYPSLTGRVEATEGTIFFRGNRFDILHASADFVDRNRINPTLDIRAEADVKTYLLILDVNGDLDHLTANVTSDPPLSTVDIISLMTTGKSIDTASDSTRRQTEMAGLSAASILSESLTGVIGKRVQRIFGLEAFRVDPFLAGAENSPTARVTLSERLSQDLTITYSRNLSTAEEQIIVVEYDVSKGLSIVATRDTDGKFGLDFRLRKRFR
jgi:hypothetical protein